MESRTQGSRPRPRTQKKSEAKAKDSLSEDRHSRGQGQECSRPRTKNTSASALQKKKKKRSSQKFFKQSPQKNVFQKIFQALHKILTIQKILLSSSRGQANFRGFEASRPRPTPRTSKCVLRTPLWSLPKSLNNAELYGTELYGLWSVQVVHCNLHSAMLQSTKGYIEHEAQVPTGKFVSAHCIAESLRQIGAENAS